MLGATFEFSQEIVNYQLLFSKTLSLYTAAQIPFFFFCFF